MIKQLVKYSSLLWQQVLKISTCQFLKIMVLNFCLADYGKVSYSFLFGKQHCAASKNNADETWCRLENHNNELKNAVKHVRYLAKKSSLWLLPSLQLILKVQHVAGSR